MTTTMPVQTCLYLRASESPQSQRAIVDQRTRCLEWAANNNCEVVEEFCDTAGGQADNRPGLKRLLERALQADRPYQQIVASSLARMFRRTEELIVCRERLGRNGVAIVSIAPEFGVAVGTFASAARASV